MPVCFAAEETSVLLDRSVRADLGERARPLPGDQFIQRPLASITHAITIRRPPHLVWPWLVQMGAGRAGWYSFDWVDNGGRRSADRILAEFQAIEQGTVFPAVPGATDAFILLQYERGRWLVLGWVPDQTAAPITTWAIVLEEQRPGWTRLIERGRVRSPYRPYGLPEGIARRLGPIAHAIMIREHLLGIARRAESPSAEAGPS